MDPKLVSRLVLIAILIGLVSSSQAVDAQRSPKVLSWGKIIDPDGDCTFEPGNNGSVVITVPGAPHDLSYAGGKGKRNAPRVLREVEGDFIMRVKVVGEFGPGDEPSLKGWPVFQSAGLLIWIDENHFIRLERDIQQIDGKGYCFAPLFEQWKEKKFVGNTQPVESSDFFQHNFTYLQLERIGSQVTARISHDGAEWIGYEPIEVQLPFKVSVGVLAINTSKKPLKVTFESPLFFERKVDGT